MKTRILQSLIVTLSLLIPAGIRAAGEPAKPSVPQIEVAFVVDTTGSMGGLIQAAKEKIWAIANTLATTKPAPHIQVALVACRNRGDAYVTKSNLDLPIYDCVKAQAGKRGIAYTAGPSL